MPTSSRADVPGIPAVYAMYGGERPRTWVAYVGIAGNLQGRLTQLSCGAIAASSPARPPLA